MSDEIVLPQASSQGAVIEQSRAIAEVAAAIQVAQQFPRSIDAARSEMQATCGSLAVAERAFYEVPNRGTGLSVHAARELARVWGNIDYGVRELHRDDGVSEMQAWAWDQQTNTRSTRSFIQPHEKSTRTGRKKLTDLGDIYLNNQNTGARAVRECIFSVLPGWLITEAQNALRATLERGNGQTLLERAKSAVAAFGKLKVTPEQLASRVGKPWSQWLPADLADLQRIYASITQDGISVAEFFPEKPIEIGTGEVEL